MARPTPVQRRRVERFEAVLRVLEPGLNLLLAAGERLSRLVDRTPDDDYVPPRAPTGRRPAR